MLFANMGIPIIGVAMPTMMLLLLPIVTVEVAVFRGYLGRRVRQTFLDTLLANFWSTMVGVPLAWLPFVIGQFAAGGTTLWPVETSQQRFEAVLWQAAWLMPYRDQLAWMVPTASLLMLSPFYVGSVTVEYLVLARRWSEVCRRQLVTAVVLANALSYIGLGCCYALQLWLAVRAGSVT